MIKRTEVNNNGCEELGILAFEAVTIAQKEPDNRKFQAEASRENCQGFEVQSKTYHEDMIHKLTQPEQK